MQSDINETNSSSEQLSESLCAFRNALEFFGNNLTQNGFQISSKDYAHNLSSGLWQITNGLIKMQEQIEKMARGK